MNPLYSSPPTPKAESAFKTYIVPLGGIVSSIIGALNSAGLPSWGQNILIGFVAVAFVAGLQPFVMLAYKAYAARKARRTEAELFYPRMSLGIKRLSEQLNSSMSNTLYYELRHVVMNNGRVLSIDLQEFERLREWVQVVAKRIAAKRASDFRDVLGEACLAVNQYNQCCHGIGNRIGEISAQAGGAEWGGLKVEWNRGADNQALFVRDWANLCEEINHKVGRDICLAYYPPLRRLE